MLDVLKEKTDSEMNREISVGIINNKNTYQNNKTEENVKESENRTHKQDIFEEEDLSQEIKMANEEHQDDCDNTKIMNTFPANFTKQSFLQTREQNRQEIQKSIGVDNDDCCENETEYEDCEVHQGTFNSQKDIKQICIGNEIINDDWTQTSNGYGELNMDNEEKEDDCNETNQTYSASDNSVGQNEIQTENESGQELSETNCVDAVDYDNHETDDEESDLYQDAFFRHEGTDIMSLDIKLQKQEHDENKRENIKVRIDKEDKEYNGCYHMDNEKGKANDEYIVVEELNFSQTREQNEQKFRESNEKERTDCEEHKRTDKMPDNSICCNSSKKDAFRKNLREDRDRDETHVREEGVVDRKLNDIQIREQNEFEFQNKTRGDISDESKMDQENLNDLNLERKMPMKIDVVARKRVAIKEQTGQRDEETKELNDAIESSADTSSDSYQEDLEAEINTKNTKPLESNVNIDKRTKTKANFNCNSFKIGIYINVFLLHVFSQFALVTFAFFGPPYCTCLSEASLISEQKPESQKEVVKAICIQNSSIFQSQSNLLVYAVRFGPTYLPPEPLYEPDITSNRTINTTVFMATITNNPSADRAHEMFDYRNDSPENYISLRRNQQIDSVQNDDDFSMAPLPFLGNRSRQFEPAGLNFPTVQCQDQQLSFSGTSISSSQIVNFGERSETHTFFNQDAPESSQVPEAADEIGALYLQEFSSMQGEFSVGLSDRAVRAQTFRDTNNRWPHAYISPERMAEAGLFYTGIGDKTVCFYCRNCMEDWKPGDCPLFEHIKLYPDCYYIRNQLRNRPQLQMQMNEFQPRAERERIHSGHEDGSETRSESINMQAQNIQQPDPHDPGNILYQRLQNDVSGTRRSSGSLFRRSFSMPEDDTEGLNTQHIGNRRSRNRSHPGRITRRALKLTPYDNQASSLRHNFDGQDRSFIRQQRGHVCVQEQNLLCNTVDPYTQCDVDLVRERQSERRSRGSISYQAIYQNELTESTANYFERLPDAMLDNMPDLPDPCNLWGSETQRASIVTSRESVVRISRRRSTVYNRANSNNSRRPAGHTSQGNLIGEILDSECGNRILNEGFQRSDVARAIAISLRSTITSETGYEGIYETILTILGVMRARRRPRR